MKKLIIGIVLLFFFTVNAQAQACPTGQVCIPQTEANKLFDAVNRLIAAEDALKKQGALLATTESSLARALSIIERYEARDVVDKQIQIKKDELLAIAVQIGETWKKLAEDLQARLNKPKSTWDKIGGLLKRAADILAGMALGRIL